MTALTVGGMMPIESAIGVLVRAQATTLDHFIDFGINEAWKSLQSHVEAGNGELLLKAIARCSLAERQVSTFIATQLLFTSAVTLWSVVIPDVAERILNGVDLKLQLGICLIFIDMSAAHENLSGIPCLFFERLNLEVLPLCGSVAERSISKSGKPTRLHIEANNAVVALYPWCCLGLRTPRHIQNIDAIDSIPWKSLSCWMNGVKQIRDWHSFSVTFCEAFVVLEKAVNSLITFREKLEFAKCQKTIFLETIESSAMLLDRLQKLSTLIATCCLIHIEGSLSYSEIAHSVLRFASKIHPESGNEPSQFNTIVLLLAAAITFGKAPKKAQRSGIWEANKNVAQSVSSVLMERALRFGDENVQHLASVLAQSLVNLDINSSQLIDVSTDALIEMLSTRDNISPLVIRFVAHAASRRPHLVIPSLFQLLASPDRGVRQNAIEVISLLPTSAVQNPDIAHRLAIELIQRIADEELLVRVAAAKVFSIVDCNEVFRPLLLLASQRDPIGKRRSGAQMALKAALSAHTETAKAIILLVNEAETSARTATVPAPRTPSDITLYSMAKTDLAIQDEENHLQSLDPSRVVINAVTQWCESVSQDNWSTILPEYIGFVCSKPGELCIKVLSVLALKYEFSAEAVVECILGKMKSKAEGQLWFEDKPAHGDWIYHIVAPLLCFRVSPDELFKQKSCFTLFQTLQDCLFGDKAGTLKALLTTRSAHDCLRVFVDVFCRFPDLQVLPVLVHQGEKELAGNGAGLRVVLFAISTCLSHSQLLATQDKPQFVVLEELVFKVFSHLVLPVLTGSFQCSVESEKLCRGAAETAGLCLLSSMLMGAESQVVNVVCAAMKSGASHAAITLLSAIHIMRSHKDAPTLARQFCSIFLEQCVSQANKLCCTGKFDLAKSYVSVTFNLLSVPGFQLDDETVAPMMSFASGCFCFEKSSVIQFEGLKILGALMSLRADLFVFVGEKELQRVVARLSSISLMHSCAQARELAEKLLKVLTGNE